MNNQGDFVGKQPYLEPGKNLVELDGRYYRVLVMECPYDSISDPLTQAYFMKVAAMKISGYQESYPYGVLPLDSYDFFAFHLVLCQENGGELRPVMAMKSVTLSRCEIHGLPFPSFGLIEHPEPNLYRKAMEAFITRAKRGGHEVGYNGSWTVAPDFRRDTQLRALAKDIATSFFVHHYSGRKISRILAGTTTRLRTDEYARYLGFNNLSWQGRELPLINCAHFYDESVRLVFLEGEWSDGAKETARRYQELWEKRLVISEAPDSKSRQAA